MIEVKNLSKVFRTYQKEPGVMGSLKSMFNRKWVEKWAIKDINLSIGAGEIVGLVGANGAGKTTLVKILSGIVYPSSGEAKVLGYSPWLKEDPYRRQMSLIMGQKASLWWDLPALDCFQLLKEIYQIPSNQFKKDCDYLTELLGIEGQLKTQIRRLSLGERMKVELMAALLHRPKIVYLDEPTIGLDLTAQKAIRSFILEYQKEFQPAMILTSHYMEDIEKLCKRILIMKSGEIIYDGELKAIHEHYATSKIITFRLPTENQLQTWPAELGTLMPAEGEMIRIQVPRDQLKKSISHLLETQAPDDLTVQDIDIAHTIEAIIRKGLT